MTDIISHMRRSRRVYRVLWYIFNFLPVEPPTKPKIDLHKGRLLIHLVQLFIMLRLLVGSLP